MAKLSDERRAKFEKWCSDSGMFTDWTKGPDGSYQKPRVSLAWDAWNAAIEAEAIAGVLAEWQPMETAPRDGTVILVTGLEFGVGPGRYYLEAEWMDGHFYDATDALGEILAESYLTHWMPLPAHPSSREEVSKVSELYRPGLQGCSDGNCIIQKPDGMHTNGGCMCSKELARLKPHGRNALMTINFLRSQIKEKQNHCSRCKSLLTGGPYMLMREGFCCNICAPVEKP